MANDRIQIIIDDRVASARLKGIRASAGNLRPAFINFEAYMQRVITLMFRRNRRGGGDRGVTWPFFKRIGQLRPSGKRVTRNSSLMRDTGRMITAVLSKSRRTATRLEMDTPVEYAKWQHQMRNFQFFEYPKDVEQLRRFIIRSIGNGR